MKKISGEDLQDVTGGRVEVEEEHLGRPKTSDCVTEGDDQLERPNGQTCMEYCHACAA